MRIIFLNRFFHPDHSASSQLLGDLAFCLAERGERVHVIASRQCYDNPDAALAPFDRERGVDIHRVATTRFGRLSLPGRAIDYLSFYLAAGWMLLCLARRGDVVIAKTDPPMLSIIAAALAPLRGFKTVNWLQDMYPEIATELGVSALKGILGRGLVAVRDASLRSAAMNVAIGEDMAQRLRTAGVAPERLRVIANWTDDEAIVPVDDQTNPLRRQWALADKFVVAYSGNLGRAHDVETMLGAAERLRSRDDIAFLFIGGGNELTELETEMRRRGMTNILFKPYQPRSLLAQSLGVADIHWLSLKAGLDGLLLPCKFYGIAAAGRPIIVVGSPDGELAKLVSQYESGFHVGLGRSEEFAHIIASLANDRPRCHQLGMNARRMLEARFTKAQALERWRAVLRNAAGATSDRIFLDS